MQDKNNHLEEFQTIGQRIRVARKARGLTQEELGAAIDAAKASIARWESTSRNPGGPTLVALSKALKVPLEWLVAGQGAPPETTEEKLARLVKDRKVRLRQILESQPDLEDFAERCSVNVLYLKQAKIENEYDILSLDEALRIAQAAKKSPAWLLFGERAEDVIFAPDPKLMHLSPHQKEFLLGFDPILGADPKPSEQSEGITLERRQRLEQILRAQIDLASLASKAGVPESSIKEYLSGKRTLNFDQIAKIAIAAGLSLNWLLFGDPTSDAITF
jgi:transcriptional regulator with XRE-family HTH domain